MYRCYGKLVKSYPLPQFWKRHSTYYTSQFISLLYTQIVVGNTMRKLFTIKTRGRV